jgi:DNA processing protein
LDEQTKQCWVGFNLVKGIGAARLKGLLAYFGDIQSAWQAPEPALLASGLNAKIVRLMQQVKAENRLVKVWEELQRQDIRVYTWEDEDYPQRLLEIDQSPPVLYSRGRLHPADDWAVAMVGTRRATSYGRQAAAEIASELARNGITIVSGLARGVDAIAHESTLEAGGRTLAVLGSGVDVIYPPEHRRLADSIHQQGALLSDYPPGSQPEAANFPPRNRIISGLSRAVLVVEAGNTSGALITAAFAAEQGREVFALPGSIYAPQSRGTNLLIQQGARLLLNPQEILEGLNLSMVKEQRTARVVLPADATEARLFQVLGVEPKHVDEIRAQVSLPIEQVSAALAMMELKGMIRGVGGMQYVAVRELTSDYELGGETG